MTFTTSGTSPETGWQTTDEGTWRPPGGVGPHGHPGTDITSSIPASSGGLPIGAITMWMLSTPPANWLILDGSSFSAATYPALASHLGGTTLPNLKQKAPVGYDAATAPFNSLGASGGSKDAPVITHTHSEATYHWHNISHGHTTTDPGHSHFPNDGSSAGFVVQHPSTTLTLAGQPLGAGATYDTGTGKTRSSATGLSVDGTGSDSGTNVTAVTMAAPAGAVAGTNQNLQPYIVLNFIIKAA